MSRTQLSPSSCPPFLRQPYASGAEHEEAARASFSDCPPGNNNADPDQGPVGIHEPCGPGAGPWTRAAATTETTAWIRAKQLLDESDDPRL